MSESTASTAGEPAFPTSITGDNDGMSLRTYLAGQALAGLCANQFFMKDASDTCRANKDLLVDGFALSAVQFADALLAELAKEKP